VALPVNYYCGASLLQNAAILGEALLSFGRAQIMVVCGVFWT
jgi:hypothetical protein